MLIKVQETLEKIMAESETARHSLEYAQLMVWLAQNPYAAEHIKDVWLSLGMNGMSKPETIRRAWQKIRANHPEYCDDDATKMYRAKLEKEYRDYARMDMSTQKSPGLLGR